MRIAIFSDVHANKEMLKIALEQFEHLDVKLIVCLGDIIGYGRYPNESCEIMMSHKVLSVAGNHDLAAVSIIEPFYFSRLAKKNILWTRSVLNFKSKQFLKKLPFHLLINNELLFVHGSFSKFDMYLDNKEKALKEYKRICHKLPKVRICFFGHTHKRQIYEILNHECDIINIQSRDVFLDPTKFYFINPGSLSLPRNASDKYSFCIYDMKEHMVSFESVSLLADRNCQGIYYPPLTRGLFNEYINYYRRLLKKATCLLIRKLILKRFWPKFDSFKLPSSILYKSKIRYLEVKNNAIARRKDCSCACDT